MIRLSIIVPIYNMEKYLHRCVDSIINQTYENLEIILVDDGSKDLSPAICDEYASKDSRIKVIHKKNGGQGDARNFGIEQATGDYLGFIDSDDYVRPHMFESLLSLCVENNAQIAICEMYKDENELKSDFAPQIKVLNKEEFYPLLLEDLISSHPCNKLFRADLFKGIRFPLRNSVDDMMIMPAIFDKCHEIVCTNEPLYFYYIGRADSVSNNRKTIHINSYERSVAFMERYVLAKERGLLEADVILKKTVSFSVGTLGLLLERKNENWEKEINMILTFLKKNSQEIYTNQKIDIARKFAVWILLNVPGQYKWFLKIYKLFF